jgi:FkbM family methyltransferase
MHSQNNEEELILRHFGNRIGCVLDVGANDGTTLSNSYAAIERGWSAVLVEPAPSAWSRLIALHADRIASGQVECHQLAIAHVTGHMLFHESAEHLGKGDVALLSTLSENEAKRWTSSFTTVGVETLKWDAFRKKTAHTVFNLVSIDCEGMDYWILSQMDLKGMGVEMLIIEDNQGNERAFTDYCGSYGMKKLTRNAENIIYVL